MPEQRFYTGYSGQMAVVAELLIRECNAAIPAFDVGTDVFAFKEDREEIARLQVKLARARAAKRTSGWSARFVIPLAVLNTIDRPPLYYVLAVRAGDQWLEFIVISRLRLRKYRQDNEAFGTDDKYGKNLSLTVRFSPDALVCSGVDLTPYRNAWNTLPPLMPPAPSILASADPARPKARRER